MAIHARNLSKTLPRDLNGYSKKLQSLCQYAQKGDEKMSRKTTTTLTWTLTAIVEADAPALDSIDHASFHTGRTNDEIESSWGLDAKSLPSGILHVIKESDLEGNALESGVVIEMSSLRKQKDGGWFPFQCVMHSSRRSRFRPRGVYVCAETANSMEVVNISCCPPKELPKVIWIRISTLPEKTLAWLLSSSLRGDSNQTRLSDFSDIGDLSPPPPGEPLALPGPPNSPYEFM